MPLQLRAARCGAEAQERAGTDLVRKVLPFSLRASSNDDGDTLEDSHRLQTALFHEEHLPLQAAAAAVKRETASLSFDDSFLRQQHAHGMYVQALSELMQSAVVPGLAAVRADRFTAEQRRSALLTRLQRALEVRFPRVHVFSAVAAMLCLRNLALVHGNTSWPGRCTCLWEYQWLRCRFGTGQAHCDARLPLAQSTFDNIWLI